MVQRLDNMPGKQNLPAVVGDPGTIQTLPAQVGDTGVRVELQAATPNNMPQTNPLPPSNVNDMNVSANARSLYVDPTPIYQPSLDFINQERIRANERYAQNKADITNIFGNLTQVNKESQDRVRKQFEASVANQQMATAQRIAQARTGAEQTQQAAIQAMDERGGGPMGNLMASPAAVASERAIGDIGSYAQIWEGQQRAIQEQTQQDLQAALSGLGFQQGQAIGQLQRSLEDTLFGIGGREADVMSQLAQAQFAGRQGVAQANYQEVLQRQAQAAAERRAAMELANQPREYSSGVTGVFERIADLAGEDSAVEFSQSIASILSGGSTFKGRRQQFNTPKSLSEALAQWVRQNPDLAPYYQGYAAEAFSDIFSKSIPGTSSSVPGVINYFGEG